MTIGMRKEKSEVSYVFVGLIKLSAQLRSITKKTPATDHAFQRRIP